MVWGTGAPRREFLHVDDLADACVFLMDHYDEDEHINVGHGRRPDDLANWPRWFGEIVHPEARAGVRYVEARRHAAQSCSMSSRLHALGWRHRI